MAIYSLAIEASPLCAGVPNFFWELQASPLANVYLTEIWVMDLALNGGSTALELARTATVGVALNPISPLAEDPSSPAALSIIATQWSTPPTLAANDLRRWSVGSASPSGIHLMAAFPRGLLVPAAKSICLDLASSSSNQGASIFDVNAVVTE